MTFDKDIDNSIYDTMLEEIVVEYAQNGEDKALDFLVSKYKNFVRSKARTYYLIGGDKEDIVQEGMIGLFKAIRDFNSEKNVSFTSFADMCIVRQIITAIKTASRQKHMPLNSYVSFSKIISEEYGYSLLDVITYALAENPEEFIIGKEEMSYIEEKMQKALSEFEYGVFTLFLQGKQYLEIASELHKDAKAIDNALQRIKKKLHNHLKKQGA